MNLTIHSVETLSKSGLPYVGRQITAGFPSPAEDYLENILDLNEIVVKNPSATFYGRVNGNSMKDAGAADGDLLVIDKSLEYRHDALAVCWIDGEFTLKRLRTVRGQLYLIPANPDYEPIAVKEGAEFMVWGIVTYILKKAF
ncbi:DNA polymerase V [Hydrogenispora ethanolica]|jgi:DNA polymerase V|uniref:DNA polymerase V n=1 Tax=Hydrogenispora ethanolica TaxID=1082276 RepID=A0A4R1RZY0_HYDET|nr:translesion error-prone DNA polymerase V autoproteolytic subunit [Hydrogenispora ethanolica]TCL72393.1 DNA polymerase V [Hydrogenispora ethanolica]